MDRPGYKKDFKTHCRHPSAHCACLTEAWRFWSSCAWNSRLRITWRTFICPHCSRCIYIRASLHALHI